MDHEKAIARRVFCPVVDRHDGDGVNDCYERTGYRDRDRDGVANRYGRYDDRRYISRHRYNVGRFYAPRSYRYVHCDIGSRLPRNYHGSTYYINYRPYGLYSPPSGYRWNRVGPDAYLVAVANGPGARRHLQPVLLRPDCVHQACFEEGRRKPALFLACQRAERDMAAAFH